MAGLVLSQAATGAAAQSAPTVKSGQTSLGEILTGPDGRTLYMFTKDTAGVSNCTGACLQNWPPLTVATGETPVADTGLGLTLGTIVRPDTGATQVTLAGIPLYHWAADQAPGDTKGQGVAGFWFVLDKTGAAVPVAAPAATATSPAAPTTVAPSAPATGTGPTTGDSAALQWLGVIALSASLALAVTTLAAKRRG